MLWLSTYRLLWFILLPLLLIWLLLKSLKEPDYRKQLGQRLGYLPKQTLVQRNKQALIWLHCVSVGEFIASKPLIDILLKSGTYQLLITTTTPSGSKQVIKDYPQVLHIYLPFDITSFYRRIIHQLKPKICVLMETEIWANLITVLDKNNIPIILANARLSARSFKNYQRFNFLARLIIKKITLIASQNVQTTHYFEQLGASKIQTVGNIKFDINTQHLPNQAQIKQLINGRQNILFASTHADEEAQILKAYQSHQSQLNNTLMIIAPRHPKRCTQIIQLTQKHNLSYQRYSQNQVCGDNIDVLLVDTLGELLSFYSLADICFIGGSLVRQGGHNMLEAAAFKKPILFGQYTFNFPEICQQLLQLKGAIQVQNIDDLFQKILVLQKNARHREQIASQAYGYFCQNQGATKQIFQKIQSLI